jgi:aminopyrrolnitrin oxygenase
MHLPAAERFAAYPATWYLFGAGRELRRGPVSRDMFGRRLVAFRTATGRLCVMEARCAHLGADLGRGCVSGEAIRCPFHHWEYAADGHCVRIPGNAEIPGRARQVVYPAVERHGYIFVFNGREPLFPLPFFFDVSPEQFVAGRPFRFIAECSWFMLTANGFDGAHFEAVHDRTLIGPAVVDCPTPFARRIRYRAQVTGNSLFDRLLRRFAGDPVDVSITSWGGPVVLVTGTFRRTCSYIWIAAHPIAEHRLQVEVISFAPRSRWWLARALLQPIGLWVRRLFTMGFMRNDINRLAGIRYNPAGLVAADRLMSEFFEWAAALPRGFDEAASTAPSTPAVMPRPLNVITSNPVPCEDRP